MPKNLDTTIIRIHCSGCGIACARNIERHRYEEYKKHCQLDLYGGVKAEWYYADEREGNNDKCGSC